jgi:hypothetical protein
MRIANTQDNTFTARISVINGNSDQWSNTYTVVNSNSASWSGGGTGNIGTIQTYLSSNNVLLNGATVTGNVSASGNISCNGSLSATTIFTTGSGNVIFDSGNYRRNNDPTIIIGANSGQHLRFRAGGATNSEIRMTILSSGEVGIGTSITETAAAGNGGLRIKNNLLVNGNTNITGTLSASNFRIPDSSNIGVGINALVVTTGANNTAVGTNALAPNTTGANNIAVGVNALANNQTGANNTAVGVGALETNVSATNNTAFGCNVLRSNTGGVNNVGVGISALHYNTTGYNSTAVGQGSLYNCTDGNSNAALGLNAGLTIQSGTKNTMLGTQTDVDAQARNSCVVIGANTISPAVDGSLAIGNAMGNLVTSSSTGAAANKDLIIYLNGVKYYIALKT